MFQMLHQLLGAMLCARKHHGAAIRVFGQVLLEDFGLLAGALNEVHVLLDLVGSLARRRDFDALRIAEIFGGEISDCLRHGGRKQQRLAISSAPAWRSCAGHG